tara:strand:+ start:998 stop:1297 length:300 start_codon:yes stop_codon:yes gene_type:complete
LLNDRIPSSQYQPVSVDLLEKFHLSPAILKAKEGLALINGTQFMCSVGSLALQNAVHLIRAAHIATACTLVALNGHPEVRWWWSWGGYSNLLGNQHATI